MQKILPITITKKKKSKRNEGIIKAYILMQNPERNNILKKETKKSSKASNNCGTNHNTLCRNRRKQILKFRIPCVTYETNISTQKANKTAKLQFSSSCASLDESVFHKNLLLT